MAIRAVDEQLLDIIKENKKISKEDFKKEAMKIGYSKSELEWNLENMIKGGYISYKNNEYIYIGDTYHIGEKY